MRTPRTIVQLIYESTDITQDVAADLISFTYNDNESGEADDISVKLKNEHGRWTNSWHPSKGDTLRATIIDDNGELNCGTFKIDDLTSGFSPSTFTIGAVSVPLDETIRRTAKSKTWEDVKLSGICNEIASKGGLSVIYDVDRDPNYDRLSQREESDLKFLERLCKAEGYSLKVTDDQLVVFDQEKYEAKPPVFTIEQGVDDITGGSLKSQAFDLYKSCTVCYSDPETEEEIEAEFFAPNIQKGMSMRLVKRADSIAQAKRWAKAELREKNKYEVSGDLNVVGATYMVAGFTLQLKNFGVYDGKYIVEKAAHNVNNGYTVALTIRRVLEGY